MKIYQWILYSGIAALVFFVATFLTGVFQMPFKWHVGLAWAALAVGVFHASLVVRKNMKRPKT